MAETQTQEYPTERAQVFTRRSQQTWTETQFQQVTEAANRHFRGNLSACIRTAVRDALKAWETSPPN